VDSGKELFDLPVLNSPLVGLTFSPDGQHLAVGDGRGRVLIWDRAGTRLHEGPCEGPCWRLAFSPDGRRLAGADREQVKVWDVPTGQEVLLLRGAGPRPGDGGFNPALAWDEEGKQLAVANWEGKISIWSASRPGPWESVQARAAAWALAEAEGAAGTGDHYAVAFHLRRALRDESPDFLARLRRADLLLACGAIDQAAREYRAGLAGGEVLAGVRWLQGARALLLGGDVEGHRRLCDRILARFGPDQYASDLCAPIHACVLAPGVGDPARLVRLARSGLAGAQPPEHAGFLYVLGLAHLRAGEWDQAIRRLRESAEKDPGSACVRWLALALAHHRRGEPKEARLWLEKAEKWQREKASPASEAGYRHGGRWYDFQILYREVQSTLGAAKS
jgi:tetratricopeptide (TPR) repeat protein